MNILFRELIFIHLNYNIGFFLKELIYFGPVDLAVKYELEPVLWARVPNVRLFGRKILRWQKVCVEAYFQRVLQHCRYQSRQQWTRELQTRVRINLDEVRFELIINHKVQAEDLHAVETAFGVQLPMTSPEDVGCQLIHLGYNVPLKAYVEVWVVLVDKLLKFIV